MLGQLIEYYIEKISMEKFGCPKVNFGLLHWQGDSLAYSILMTILYLIWSKGHWEPYNEVDSQSLAKHIRIWTWNLWIQCWSNGLAGYLSEGSSVQNHWVASRSTQPYILSRSMKWVPDTPGDLVVKSKLSPHKASAALRQLNMKKGHKVFFKFFFFFEALIYCA